MKHPFKVSVLAISAALLAAGAYAASDPIASRQAIMKNVGASMKASVQMLKGELEYNATTAEIAMRAINSSAIGVVNFFPEDSKTGGETTVAPTIWEDMDGFKALAAKLAETSAAAAVAAKDGKEAFAVAVGQVGANCKACHEKYRIKKQ